MLRFLWTAFRCAGRDLWHSALSVKSPTNARRAKEKPRKTGLFLDPERRSELAAGRLARHEVVEGVLGDAEPQHLFLAKRHHRIVDLLELRILGVDLGIDLV